MSNKIKQSKPLSDTDKKLQERFTEDIANQSKLMDDIGKIFITIQLAVPSIYATVLKLSLEGKDILNNKNMLMLVFALWFISLVFSFLSIFPRKYKVNINRLDEIENFYFNSARIKIKFLAISAILFFIGIICSVYALIEKGI